MKITQSQLLELLKVVGLKDVQLVEADEESEYDKDTALQAIDGSRKPIIAQQVLDEKEEELTKSITGMNGNILERQLVKQFGIAAKDLKGIEKNDEKIAFAIQQFMSKQSEEKQDVQAAIEEVRQALLAEHETKVAEIQTQLENANKKYIDRDVLEWVETSLKEAPISERADRKVIAKQFKNHLENQFALNYKEQDRLVELFDKTNPNKPALNSAKTGAPDVLELAKEFLTPLGIWETDMRGKPPVIPNGDPYKAPTNNSPQPKTAQAFNEGLKAYAAQQGIVTP